MSIYWSYDGLKNYCRKLNIDNSQTGKIIDHRVIILQMMSSTIYRGNEKDFKLIFAYQKNLKA